MKRTLFLLLILSALMTGCNVNRLMTDIVLNPRVKYKLQPVPKESNPDYYIYIGKRFTKANVLKYYDLTRQIDSIEQKLKTASQFATDYLENKKSKLQSQINEIPKDSTVNYIVSFTDDIKGINYSIVRTYWWDYNNWRFLVPFLTDFNRYHNFNQCVNRAMDKCLKYNCDGVIIAGDYSTFKLFMVKR
jgi:hypothetical protein